MDDKEYSEVMKEAIKTSYKTIMVLTSCSFVVVCIIICAVIFGKGLDSTSVNGNHNTITQTSNDYTKN